MQITSSYGMDAVQRNNQAAAGKNPEPPCCSQRSGRTFEEKDSVNISPQARALERGLSTGDLIGLLGLDKNEDGNIDIGEIRADVTENLAAFEEEVNSFFADAGIDTTRRIELLCGSDGKIIVSGEHPDKEKIQSFFEQNPELANRFRRISANSALLEAAEDAVDFRKAYSIDPEAAVSEFAYLFNPDRQHFFSISFLESEMELNSFLKDSITGGYGI